MRGLYVVGSVGSGWLWMAMALLACAPLGLALAVFVVAFCVTFVVLCAVAVGGMADEDGGLQDGSIR